MARRVKVVPAAELRGMLAAAVLGKPASAQLGAITLRPHQVAAVSRIREALSVFGGVLLADAVGLGKTYVALAVAGSYAKPLVIAPAILQAQWERSGRAAATRFCFTSTELLSRSDRPSSPVRRHLPASEPDLVVVDEAHHFRNAGTRRYARLAHLTATTPVLLLSATPIHNHREDLIALLALFLGSRAATLSPEDVGGCVIRREQRDVAEVRFPRVAGARRVVIPPAGHVLDRIVALPPPVPPADGTDAGPLIRSGLAQLWGSSDAALLAGITRRLTRGEALRAVVRGGCVPTKRDLAAWVVDDATIQHGFAELLCTSTQTAGPAIEQAIDEHLTALKDLAGVVRTSSSRDAARIAALRRIRDAHPQARIIVFTAFASTARYAYDALAGSGKVALVTGRGARIASGPLPAAEVLRMFRSFAHRREAIDMLIATDLLSEGIDLPEASVIVHLDLPWTPARLEQRLGRLRRARASDEPITSYVFSQDGPIERRLRRERVLARKAAVSARLLGSDSVPTWAPPIAQRVRGLPTGSPARAEVLRRILEGWLARDRSPERPESRHIGVAACSAAETGAIALIESNGATALLAITSGAGRKLRASPAPGVLAAVAASVVGDNRTFTCHRYLGARRAVERYRRMVRIRRLAVRGHSFAPVVADVASRLGFVLAQSPIHERAQLARRISGLRERLAGRLTAGLERRLGAIASTAGTPDELLKGLEEALVGLTPEPSAPDQLLAVLLLVPDSSGASK